MAPIEIALPNQFNMTVYLLFVVISCEPIIYSLSFTSLPRIAKLTAGYKGLCYYGCFQ